MNANATVATSSAHGLIPKNIHQMWYDRVEWDSDREPRNKPASNPGIYSAYRQGWRNMHPDYQYFMWNRRRVHALFDKHPSLAPYRAFFYHGLSRHIERCDFARYCILWLYGGAYIDMDFQCLRRLDTLLQGRSLVWAQEPPEHVWVYNQMNGRRQDLGLLFNGFIASSPGHPIWPALLDYIVTNYSPMKDVLSNTGPAVLWEFFYVMGRSIAPDSLVPSWLILPVNSSGTPNTESRGRNEAAYMVTLWSEGTGW